MSLIVSFACCSFSASQHLVGWNVDVTEVGFRSDKAVSAGDSKGADGKSADAKSGIFTARSAPAACLPLARSCWPFVCRSCAAGCFFIALAHLLLLLLRLRRRWPHLALSPRPGPRVQVWKQGQVFVVLVARDAGGAVACGRAGTRPADALLGAAQPVRRQSLVGLSLSAPSSDSAFCSTSNWDA